MTPSVVRRRVIVVSLLLLAGATVLLAVPGLRAAAHRATSVRPGWLIGAIVLEVASCVSFLAIFRRFFNEIRPADARRLAWIEMGSGALLPGGGVGSLAAGGLLLHRAGMSTRRIVEQSSGLFFLTTATNVLEGGLVGALVLYGVPAMPATAAVLLYHTIAFWIPSIGGAIAYAITEIERRGRARPAQAPGGAHPAPVPEPVG